MMAMTQSGTPFAMRPIPTLLVLGASLSLTSAHGDHSHIPEGEAISAEPMGTTLWIHILIQSLAWGILLPLGMVFGLVRSRWHVPTQILATALAVVGYFLGHAHGGRQFGKNAHASFANWLMLLLIVQVVLGVYLRLHLERGFLGRIRKWQVKGHAILGGVIPVAAWVQMLLGGIASQGFCQADHLGQCLAHFIMGSAFIAYGIVLTILLLNGQAWLARTGRSQEFWDSLIIALWGCVNTFTEHRWGNPWAHNDLQHTSMGIIWWAAGLVGMWLSRDRSGRPRRNLIPAIVILLTGWAMSAHPQTLELSTHVHSVFGYTLMAAGLTRLIEISFVLRDKVVPKNADDIDEEINSFQFLPPFLLYASGFLFMGATEEQMQLLSDAGVTHVSYILILYSIAFLLFLFVNMLLHLYSYYTASPSKGKGPSKRHDEEHSMPNGHARAPAMTERQAQDAQEFELEGLITDDEDEDGGKKHSQTNGRAQ
ncbi:hypothetical protein KC332_g13707 [Hortaea werneckii]|uniref:Cytochrome b561 domain-containing protein n=2 Tax=Hortaea werneckii TaxID=91943 RepID=A0A3M7J9B9_HORWE|nr:hypothetical protein KC350_g12695 [Hortaea werneckii]OTA34483.1 hypothetical protein BTJ68_04094 [Hortaea werneckii EXF-2000]KAI6831102.1 hypothetical protein KC358_g6652 [Hortaea werneckii]KAI6921139.1 hypothetical protein KC341_g16124 [Hortaea werneckii]KAI6937137.1 hypothetical protein KC348_g5844 [Hortaea werneckii]